MRDKIKYTTYLAGGMENVKKSEMIDFREDIENKLSHPDVFVYNPVKQESEKVAKGAGDHIKYVQGLKRGGYWDKFYDEMWKIWNGNISQNTDLLDMFKNLRMRKFIDGNYREEAKYWGDFEAVIRSDFIIVNLPLAVKSVGTIYEVMTAFLFRIPVYLIVPDGTPTDTNSSLLFGVMISNKQKLRVYKTINECVKQIKEDYKLKEE